MRVIYSMAVSLDGFIAGPDGDIGWAAPDAELTAFHNERSRELDAHLCGRGLYDDMLPCVLGGGTPFFPERRARLGLGLAESRTFGSRVVYLRYRRERDAGEG